MASDGVDLSVVAGLQQVAVLLVNLLLEQFELLGQDWQDLFDHIPVDAFGTGRGREAASVHPSLPHIDHAHQATKRDLVYHRLAVFSELEVLDESTDSVVILFCN